MKAVVGASAFGALVALALSLFVCWPVALFTGATTGFFGYHFRPEQLSSKLARIVDYVTVWQNELGIVFLSISLAVLMIVSIDPVPRVLFELALYVVVGYLVWILYVAMGFVGINILAVCRDVLVGEPMYVVGLGRSRLSGWFAIGGIFLAILAVLLLLVCCLWRLGIEVYRHERLICAVSAAVGGLVGYFLRAGVVSPLSMIVLGTSCGAVVGAIQYYFIGVPVRLWWAEKQRILREA